MTDLGLQVDELLHTDPAAERGLLYDRHVARLNKLEVEEVKRVLKDDFPGCGSRVFLVDTYHLTKSFPQCTRGHGDGRHWIYLQAAIWQVLGNTIEQAHISTHAE